MLFLRCPDSLYSLEILSDDVFFLDALNKIVLVHVVSAVLPFVLIVPDHSFLILRSVLVSLRSKCLLFFFLWQFHVIQLGKKRFRT